VPEHAGVRISVALAADDVAYLDEYARRNGLGSRSEALRRAIRLLRTIDVSGSVGPVWDRVPDGLDSPG
jgi:Arc/MetJ-type ribon-helix-helix transcriptional regulator